MFLLFQCSFRLSEKNEKDKKRKVLTPVSATPTHMLRICVNPSFNLFLSPRGDRCEHTSPTVRQLLNHGYRFETLKRRLGFTAVPCRAMANLAVELLAKVWVRTWQDKVYFDSPVSAHIKPTPATHLYAGVQTMRARICSALSCDMFARVVV